MLYQPVVSEEILEQVLNKEDLRNVAKTLDVIMEWNGAPETYEEADQIEVLAVGSNSVTYADLLEARRIIQLLLDSKQVKIHQ